MSDPVKADNPRELRYETEEDIRALRRVQELKEDHKRINRVKKMIADEQDALDAAMSGVDVLMNVDATKEL